MRNEHTRDEHGDEPLKSSTLNGAMQVAVEKYSTWRVNDFAERVYNSLYVGPYTRYIQTPAFPM